MRIAPRSIFILSAFFILFIACRHGSGKQRIHDKRTEDPLKKGRDSNNYSRPGDVSYPELPVKERPERKAEPGLDTLRPIKA